MPLPWNPNRGNEVRPRFVADVALALAFTVIAQIDVWRPDLAVWGDDPVAGPHAVNAALLLVVTVPVAWRRIAPLASTAVCMTGVGAQAAVTGEPAIGLLVVGPVAVLVYAVAAYGSRRQAWVGLALTACAAAVHDLFDPRIRTAEDVGEASYWWLVIAMTWVLGRYAGSRRRAHAAAEVARRRESEQASAEGEAVVRERLRIAHELHDVVAHNVSVVALQAGAALELLDRTPERARGPLLAIEETARSTLVEMRALLGVLRSSDEQEPPTAQPGLGDLPELASRVRAAGLPVELITHGRPHDLPPGQDVSAYRIVQEALTNALKHAVNPAGAVVSVRFEPDEVCLLITDDGHHQVQLSEDSTGHGLVGMRERVALYGGVLHAGPSRDRGFRVEARLPVGQAKP